jgi:phospholipase C
MKPILKLAMSLRRLALSTIACALAGTAVAAPAAPEGLGQVQHIVVFYLENRSFDNLYGLFPGADGLQDLSKIAPQVDKDGAAYDKTTLPRALNLSLHMYKDGDKPKDPKDELKPIDMRVPAGLPNAPFRLDPYIPLAAKSGDLIHAFFAEQRQIHGGKMDRFVANGNTGLLPLGYYDGSSLPMWKLAREFTLTDHFFHGAFGGSFLNHFWLICACSPEIAPEDWAAMDQKTLLSDPPGEGVVDRAVWARAGHFYGINTMQSVFQPHKAGTPGGELLPPQTHDTIGDRLSEKNISWAWYAGGWNDAVNETPDPSFQFHHQPFAYFAKYGEGTPGRAAHLKDETEFVKAIDSNTLPAVTFWKPIGRDNEHPGYADVLSGDIHAAQMVERIRKSPGWKSTIIIVTYDEHGGTWDHVAPPEMDEWGPGTRIPTMVISPFAKKGVVDHTVYNTDSILSLIEARYGLAPLGTRDAASDPFSGALIFGKTGGK